MTTETETRRRINVTFPESLLDLMENLIPPRERNAFIVAATEKALQRARFEAALADLREQPAWSDEDHPDLATPEDVDRYVRQLRESWMPRSWDAIAGEDENDGRASS